VISIALFCSASGSAHIMLVLMMIHSLIAGLALDYYDGGKEVSVTL